MLAVELKPGVSGARRACLRPLCGGDETLMQSGAPHETLSLIQHLLVDCGDGSLEPHRVGDLPVCDVDRLVAMLYVRDLGDRIESRARCVGCGTPFDLSFSLLELVKACDDTRARGLAGVEGPHEDGTFSLGDGRRFRLPATRDLEAASVLGPDEAARCLRRDCVLEGDPELDPQALDDAMAAVGPVLDTDIEAVCPSCGNAQRLRFDVQGFFGRALTLERHLLNHEVHQLASAYGWQRSEILAMTREDRRTHVRLILAEASRLRRRIPAMWS